jgi:predicted DNA-binding transcriptional regulator AlpA
MTEPEGVPRLYTERELAELLGLSRWTLRRERLAGRIDFVRLGDRSIAYLAEHGRAWIQNRTNKPCDTRKAGADDGETAPSGSTGGRTPHTGRSAGTTAARGRFDVVRLARKTVRKRS